MGTRKDLVATYFEGFRRGDHEMILGCHRRRRMGPAGFRHLRGKQEFDGEIENEAFEGRPGDVHRFAYCDVLTFRGDVIGRVESYLVPLTTPDAQ